MGGLVIYSLKVAILTTAFYLCWRMLLSKETLHRLNRFVLVLIPPVSMILPFCVITFHKTVIVPATETAAQAGAAMEASAPSALGAGIVAVAVYLAGVALVLFRILWSIWKIGRLIRSGYQVPVEGEKYRLVVTEEDVEPFSWMNFIVLSRKDYEAGNPEIILHEQAHINLRHSPDILMTDVLTAFQWYNPFVWMLGTDLRGIHEYEADEAVLKHGIDATQYQLFLIMKSAADHGYTLANSLRSGTIKNRIKMMIKRKTKAASSLKALLLIPIIGLSLAATARTVTDYQTPQNPEKKAPEPFQLVEEKPSFNGGNAADFSKWVNERLVYPKEAKDKKIEGRLVLSFVITEKGKMTDVRVLRGADPLLDAEAVRVVSSSPAWVPGKNKDGEYVPVTYTFPVIFKLK
ncbi:MAG: M56 family metallopeptidase [Bacteroidales bacterium]|nr:M56 family metallopeptidase [Bacteroidales bacterium]